MVPFALTSPYTASGKVAFASFPSHVRTPLYYYDLYVNTAFVLRESRMDYRDQRHIV